MTSVSCSSIAQHRRGSHRLTLSGVRKLLAPTRFIRRAKALSGRFRDTRSASKSPAWALEDGVTLRLSMCREDPTLAELFAYYGSDKGWVGTAPRPFPWPEHNYSAIYEFLFRDRRTTTRTVVECGIGTNNTDVASHMTASGRPGASLRAWRDYFPNAHIFGVDVDERILFQEDRISTARVDQTDAQSVRTFFLNSGIHSVDIMIDDGLHTFEAGVSLFESAHGWLSQDAIYVIEDVKADDLNQYVNYFSGRNFSASFIQIERPSVPILDNSLVIIRPLAGLGR